MIGKYVKRAVSDGVIGQEQELVIFLYPEALHAKSIAASSKFLGIGAIVSPCSWGPDFSVSDLQLTL